jgi:hypothetical protein
MLTSQGDEEQIFASSLGGGSHALSVLKLSASVDDTAWPTGADGAIYTTDSGTDSIDRITGPFTRGSELAAVTPCDENGAPSTCPGPGFPANYLGEINPDTGAITPVSLHGTAAQPKGMLFLS